MLTWVFHTNDTLLQPVVLDYFSIIGEIWCYKIIICILPPFVVITICLLVALTLL